MKNALLFMLLLFFFSNVSYGQSSECLKDFDYIVKKIKNDYPGYHDKVNENNVHELEYLEKKLRQNIKQYPDSCIYYLMAYTSWFKDYHLRMQAKSNKKSTLNASNDLKYYSIDIEHLDTTHTSLEGIWVCYWGEVAIKKTDQSKYIAVSINYRNFDKNQLAYEFYDVGKDFFETTSYSKSGKIQLNIKKSTLHLNNTILELHDGHRFVRKTKNPTFDKALLSSYIPQHPNGLNTYAVATHLSDSTFYIRISHFHSSLAEDLVKKHWKEIINRPNLIIDIRNNGGGQDNYYQILAKLIYTNPYETKGVEWYSTQSIIKDWENDLANGKILKGHEDETKALVEEMKKNVGGFVTHPIYGGGRIVKRDSIFPYPKKVGIIINERNASSAEQFLLSAKQSSKTILFGNKNTLGVLDYSNATRKDLPSGKYYLILPATRSKRLPDNPIDNIGIAPDIIIPLEPKLQLFDRLDDWVYFVKNYLEYQK